MFRFGIIYDLCFDFDSAKIANATLSKVSMLISSLPVWNFIKYRSIVTSISMMIVIFATSQDIKKVDSLKQKLLHATRSEKFEILNELFKQYNLVDYQVALDYASEFDLLARKIGDSLKIVEGGRKLAYSLMDLSKNDEAIDVLIKILGIAERNKEQYPELKKQIKFILNNTGLAYDYLGNYDKALEYHYKSLLTREEEGDKKSISTALNNLGLVFYHLKDNNKAIEYYQRAIDVKREIGYENDLDRITINLGLCYNNIGEYSAAIGQFDQAFSICKENCSDIMKIEGLLGLGIAHLGNGSLEKAEDCLTKSLEISKKQNNTLYQISNLHQLSLVESARGNDKKALSYLNEGLTLAEGSGFVDPLIQLYDQFAKIYEKEHNYQKTAHYLGKYIKLKDSIYSEELIKNLAKVQTNFAERENIKTIKEKEETIALQNETIALKNQILAKQRTIMAMEVTIAVLLLGFTYFSIKSARGYNASLKKHNQELELKVFERTQELQKSNEKLIKAQHDLNNFLYKASHDIRGPVATLEGLYNVITSKQNSPNELNDLIARKGAQIDKMNRILTRIALVSSIQNTFLKREEIDFHSLLNHIVELKRKNGQLKHIRVLVEVEPGLKMISDSYLIQLILENMVDNSLKFFNDSIRVAPYVKVSVNTSGSDALIKVEDNGLGITAKPRQDVFTMFLRGSERSDIGGVGLYLCKVIADRLDGTIKLEKTSKEGTVFSLKLSLDATDQIKEWNTYLEAQYREETQRQLEYENQQAAAEKNNAAGPASTKD